MDYKLVLLLIGMTLSVTNYTLYLRAIAKGKVKPHMFTWAVWTLLGAIAFAAQWSENAGLGMWQTGLMTCGTFLITIFSWFKGERNYTRSDWIALLSSLLAIPLWMATDDPVWSVILITVIDVVAAWPTARKSWSDPVHESPRAFFTAGVISGLGVSALSVHNVTTTLYSGTITTLNFMIAAMILVRRRAINPKPTAS